MLQWFRRRAAAGRRAEELYGSVVATARHPVFYRDLGVPDTPEGRFELIALHLFLALEGAKEKDTAVTELSQRTIETFVTDMDDCMREMGVGDMAVGKKVKRAAAAFYERAGAYRRGIAMQGSDLEASLSGYVFGADAEGQASKRNETAALARYVRAVAGALTRAPFNELAANGEFDCLLTNSRTEVP
jgi:cytochrome b pre-mRNA-processing protein 3